MEYETVLLGYRKSTVDAYMEKLMQQLRDKEERICQLEEELHRATYEIYGLQDEIRIYKEINRALAKWKKKEN